MSISKTQLIIAGTVASQLAVRFARFIHLDSFASKSTLLKNSLVAKIQEAVIVYFLGYVHGKPWSLLRNKVLPQLSSKVVEPFVRRYLFSSADSRIVADSTRPAPIEVTNQIQTKVAIYTDRIGRLVIDPICEELLFRFAIQGGGAAILEGSGILSSKMAKVISLVCVSIIFGLAHLNIDDINFLSKMIPGLVFGYVMNEGGLCSAIAVHCLDNIIDIIDQTRKQSLVSRQTQQTLLPPIRSTQPQKGSMRNIGAIGLLITTLFISTLTLTLKFLDLYTRQEREGI